MTSSPYEPDARIILECGGLPPLVARRGSPRLAASEPAQSWNMNVAASPLTPRSARLTPIHTDWRSQQKHPESLTIRTGTPTPFFEIPAPLFFQTMPRNTKRSSRPGLRSHDAPDFHERNGAERNRISGKISVNPNTGTRPCARPRDPSGSLLVR